MNYVITVNVDKCLGCRSCEMACAVAHSNSKELFTAIGEEPLPQYRVTVESVGEIVLPLQCRHCEDAPCVTVCPTHALEKAGPGGPVIIKEELCIGCKWCILICPFGVIGMNREGKAAIKCDLCQERTGEGEQPACVEACPTGALSFEKIEEVIKEKKRKFLVDFEKGEKLARGE
ncbi:4Fe-4S dicluster domain-containing protein [Candidatus Aerophobetes bacterium]|nr:4Fe-4S dicluster domain-containing protein [Candidatus Aerophobetes bacterium]